MFGQCRDTPYLCLLGMQTFTFQSPLELLAKENYLVIYFVPKSLASNG